MKNIKQIKNRISGILICIILAAISINQLYAVEEFPGTIKRNPNNVCQVLVTIQYLLWYADSAICADVQAKLSQKYGNLNLTIPCKRPPHCPVIITIVVKRQEEVTDPNERKKYWWIKMCVDDSLPSVAAIGAPNQKKQGNYFDGEWRIGRAAEEYAHESLHNMGLKDQYCGRKNISGTVGGGSYSITGVESHCNPGPDPGGNGASGCCTPPANGRCTAPCTGHETDLMGSLWHPQDITQPYHPVSNPAVVNDISAENIMEAITAAGENNCPEIPCCPLPPAPPCPHEMLHVMSVTVPSSPGTCVHPVTGDQFDPWPVTDTCGGHAFVNDFNGLATLAGAILPVGTTNIVWTYTDLCENTVSCTQEFTVTEFIAEPPVIICPAGFVVTTDPGVCTHEILADEADPLFYEDNCGVHEINNSYSGTSTLAGTLLPLGTTQILWTAVDNSGNISQCDLAVTVTDSEPPTLICPPDITIEYADTTFDPGSDPFDGIISDNCGIPVLTNNAPPDFPVGTTALLWTATDAAGNEASCPQLITVLPESLVEVSISGTEINCKGAATGDFSGDVSIYMGYGVSSVTLTPDLAPPDPAAAYLWSTGEITESIIVSPVATTTYELTVTSGGQQITASITVNVIDITCGKKKVYICHNGTTQCVSIKAVPAHMAHPGDCLGECISLKNLESADQLNSGEIVLMVFPNPFSYKTSIYFSVPSEDHVRIEAYDVSGRFTGTLFNGEVDAGIEYEAVFDGNELPQGIYFFKIISTTDVLTGKMMLIRE